MQNHYHGVSNLNASEALTEEEINFCDEFQIYILKNWRDFLIKKKSFVKQSK